MRYFYGLGAACVLVGCGAAAGTDEEIETVSGDEAHFAVGRQTLALSDDDDVPEVVRTETLAPLAGRLATPAPGQETLPPFGTDLGFTFTHQEQVRILFGDTTTGSPFPLFNDDVQGTIPFGQCPAGNEVDEWVEAQPPSEGELSWQFAGPPITFATEPGAPNQLSFIQVVNGGVPLSMTTLQTPTAAFGDGGDNAFGLFYRRSSQECRPPTANEPACDDGLVCDTGLGSCAFLEVPCVVAAAPGARGSCPFGLFCVPSQNGLCRDNTSSIDDGGDEGRARSVAQRLELGVADPSRAEHYTSRTWVVNKFVNPSIRTVRHINFGDARGRHSDYHPADDPSSSRAKVLVWGRPAFAGTKSEGREAQLYFLFSDMPRRDASGAPTWTPQYFTGLDENQLPRFSPHQTDAAPLDLSGGAGDPHEQIDIVQQLSVSWVESLEKWVMVYGGDVETVLIPLFSPGATRTADGAMQVRFADLPWGPWSRPQPLLRAGDPLNPNAPGSQYGPGGILFHPFCAGADCVAADSTVGIGRLYAANIVDCWTEARGPDAADIYWNVATWNPYQVVLMKSRLRL